MLGDARKRIFNGTRTPLLFNCTLKEMFRNIDWAEKVINIEGEFFNNLRFADDVTVIAETLPEIIVMLKDLIQRGHREPSSLQVVRNAVVQNLAEGLTFSNLFIVGTFSQPLFHSCNNWNLRKVFRSIVVAGTFCAGRSVTGCFASSSALSLSRIFILNHL